MNLNISISIIDINGINAPVEKLACWVSYFLFLRMVLTIHTHMGFPGGVVVKSLPANAGDTGSSPGLVWEDPTCRGATRPVSHNY